MKCFPRPKNKTADLLIFSGFIAGIVMYALASVNAVLSVILKIVGILFFTMALYFLIRYRLSTFLYEIKTDARGEECLFISRLRGKNKYITEFCMPLESLCEFREVNTGKGKLTKSQPNTSVYKYNATMDPEYICEAKFSYNGDFITVIFEPDSDMANYLKKCLEI